MRIRVKSTCRLAVMVVIALGLAGPASASSWLKIGEAGWRPSLSASGGAVMQKQYAGFESSCLMGGIGEEPFSESNTDPGYAPCQGIDEPGPSELRPSLEDSNWYVAPTLNVNVEMLTPAFEWFPGSPRLFFGGELQLSFGPLKTIANEGNPTGARLPEGQVIQNVPTFALLGVGTSVRAEMRTVGWGAGGGIAFPFELMGRRVWLKPGFAWTRYTMNVDYRMEAAVKNDPELANINDPVVGDQLRQISLGGNQTKTYDGIGPSLEIELDVGQFGPFGASVFVNGSAYKILGDRSLQASQSASFEATEPTTCCVSLPPKGLIADTDSASWSYHVDPWLYRSNVGIRVHWFGF